MSETPILQLRGISKAFGSVQALTDVDFEVRRGEVMALVGDNGAGKSTLVKCVAGIHAPDSGEILFDGKPVTSAARRTRPGWESRSFTRTSHCATTSTWSRTCIWVARSATGSGA